MMILIFHVKHGGDTSIFISCHNNHIIEKKSRDVEELMSKLVVCETERRERKTVSEEVFSLFDCLFFYLCFYHCLFSCVRKARF